jgi:CBS domain-containing protein
VHDIVEFLRRQPPFEDLTEEELEELSRSVEVEFFPAGETILRQGENPVEHVRVIRRGTVELIDQGKTLDVLGEGELFGHPSMLSGLPAGFQARAGEDTLCYRLPAEAVVPLLARPAGLRFVARSLLNRPTPAMGVDPVQQPAARLVRGRPVICKPDDTVREAARRMAEAEASAALVRLEDGELGILTDHDLRDRVVAGGVDVDAPVTEVMTAPAFTVTPERLGSEVMLEMLDRGIRHVPVVWPHGEALGVLSDREILAAETRAPFSLRRSIDDAADVETLRQAVGQLNPAVIALHDAEVSAAQISSIIAVVIDALTRRLLELAAVEQGDPPRPLTWLALGSLGRREVVPSSDVDSALVWDGDEGDPEQQRYMRALGRRVVEELTTYGFAADRRGATAAHSLFDAASDTWRSRIRAAIADPDQGKALIFLSLVTDARAVYTLGDARDPLLELHQSWEHRPGLLRLMLRLALAQRPPSGLRRFRPREVLGKGPEDGRRLDIKSDGVLPVHAVARYASLAAGVHVTPTRERLSSAATAGTLPSSDAHALSEAFELFCRLRLGHQVEQLRQGLEPDDVIDVEALDPLTSRYLREAFHEVNAVHRWLKKEHSLPR